MQQNPILGESPPGTEPPEASEQAAGSDAPATAATPTGDRDGPGASRPDPTRYGDWEKNGRCIDF